MLESFLKYLQYEKRSSSHTLAAYKRDLEQFQTYLSIQYDNLPLNEVSYPILRSWVVQLSDQKLDPRSINRKIAALKTFYKFLNKREFVETNPTLRIKSLKTDKKLPSFLQETATVSLLDNVSFTPDFAGQRDKIILDILYNTGIRLSELLNLKDSDINLSQRQLKVLGKRNKERIIPFSQSLAKNILSYLDSKKNNFENNSCGMFIVTDIGQPAYPMFVYRSVKKYMSAVTTLNKKSPHVLRHTFATHLLNKGADINAVKELLGHASLAATQVYTHNSLDKLKKSFDQAHPKA